jgi:hypothetical protein
LNKSKHETVDQLKAFLVSKGLSDGSEATAKAYDLGYARAIEGKTKWNLKKYIDLMQANKKLQKRLEAGKPIHPNDYKRAMI